ncbi:hypothetical protein MRX96_002088 [Rhipicephalus microplus]
MGQTNTALVTLKGLKVPRYVHFYGAELHCYPPSPPDKWFARFVFRWAIGMTITLHQTLSYARRGAPTTLPSRIRAFPTGNPV